MVVETHHPLAQQPEEQVHREISAHEVLSARTDMVMASNPAPPSLPHHLLYVFKEMFNTFLNLSITANQLDTALIRARHWVAEDLYVGFGTLNRNNRYRLDT
jgi:hypothetical protein